MRSLILIVVLLACAARSAAAERTFAAHTNDRAEEVAGRLGMYGAWLIQSQKRFDDLLATLAHHNVTIDSRPANVDFAKEDLAVVFGYGDVGNQFSLKGLTEPGGAEARPGVEFGMSYIIYKQRGTPKFAWKCYGVPVPKAAGRVVSVHTFHPMNGGPHPDLERAHLEWRWTISPQTGEAVGGLRAAIEVREGPAEDILLRFTLQADDARKAEHGAFVGADPAREAGIHVWDGKYSNGYRNHSFEVVTPDGRTHILRPAEIPNWDKNSPHPVKITKDSPYTLPNWAEGEKAKSLKALGLDLTQKGVYTITGIYEEAHQPAVNGKPDIWGGVVRSNTVMVEKK